MTDLAKEFHKFSPKGEFFTFWKGRVALYSFLQSLNLSKGDEVILPALTCVVVPNAIIYANLKPIYVDIDPETFNINPNLIESRITSKTKVIIIQNTFGLSSNVEQIIEISKKYNCITIEDCTHGYGGTYNGKPNGSLADAAFYSSQWNKPFSTVIGGYLIINKQSLGDINNEQKSYIVPTLSQNIKIVSLFYIRKLVLNQFTYWPLLYFYRWLSRKNLILGSSQKEELEDIKIPKNYKMKMGWAQKRIAILQLKKLSSILRHRKNCSEIITNWLESNKKQFVAHKFHKNHSWLKYPICVKNRSIVMKLAEKSKVPLGDWFVSPIHPVKNNYKKWHLKIENYPNSITAANELINLPTDQLKPTKIIKFLELIKPHIR